MDTQLRLSLAAGFCLLPLAPLTLRLADLQVREHRDLASRASEEFNRSGEDIVPRADILDRSGNVLAQSAPAWSCFADKRMVQDPGKLAARLSPLLKLSEAEFRRKWREGGRIAWLKTRLSYPESLAVAQARLAGIGIVSRQDRFYPNGNLARGVLGLVSADGRGAAGVELSQDKLLSGKPVKFSLFRDGAGQTVSRTSEKAPPAPKPLRLTLDRNVEYYAEEALREAAARFSIKSGFIAVQDPNTGEILAMAEYPQTALKNGVVQNAFEPGSTFKVVAAAAAVENSLVGESETFFCENGSFEVAPGVVIHDHTPQGALTLGGILEQSSNIGIAKVAERVGAARFYRMSRAFGFASRTPVALPGETAGTMKSLAQLNRVGLASASYGYGVAVSALQALNAYSAIANGGTLWEPKLILDGAPPIAIRRVASTRTMAALRAMLEGVVERGTGAPAGIPGYRVAGKTGTSRRLDPVTKKYSLTSYNASFIGFLPAGKPLWTILVVMQDPRGQYYGAEVAAPFFAKFGRQLLALKGVPIDQEIASRPAPASRGLPQGRLAREPRPLPRPL